LKEKPTGFMVVRDFRRLPGETGAGITPELRMELRRAQERRRTAIELAQESETDLRQLTLQCDVGEPPDLVASRIRLALGLTVEEQFRWNDKRKALREWRAKVESVGVLVFQTPSLSLDIARGFSIAEDILPVVVFNRKDAVAGRTFTLLHELAHLMLHQGGICDLREHAIRPTDSDRIEVFCNAVAGATIVPTDSLLAHSVVVGHRQGAVEWRDDELQGLADTYSCSRDVVLRRLLTTRRTSSQFYELKRREYDDEYRNSRLRDAHVKKEMKRNIPVETVSAYGRPFIRLALETYHQRRITLNDLSEILGVKTRHIPRIEQRIAVSQTQGSAGAEI
jgi:Zn-dependent peptidase ImmA (M78 family)